MPEPSHQLMADALDHIRRTALRSRTETKRLRFIAKRADLALKGEPFTRESCELPKEVESPSRFAMELQMRRANARIRELEAVIAPFAAAWERRAPKGEPGTAPYERRLERALGVFYSNGNMDDRALTGQHLKDAAEALKNEEGGDNA